MRAVSEGGNAAGGKAVYRTVSNPGDVFRYKAAVRQDDVGRCISRSMRA